jgi:NAD(P)-dependent dehydrogenase (short-subunit alcohol dehydrogenase family)
MYSASKAGVIQFNRAIAFAYHNEGIRTYATAPGTIKTNLLDAEDWEVFPREYWTPMETLVRTVLDLVDGGDLKDCTGRTIAEKDAYGLTAEVYGDSYYFRDLPEHWNKGEAKMMEYTSMANQLARIEKDKQKLQNGK